MAFAINTFHFFLLNLGLALKGRVSDNGRTWLLIVGLVAWFGPPLDSPVDPPLNQEQRGRRSDSGPPILQGPPPESAVGQGQTGPRRGRRPAGPKCRTPASPPWRGPPQGPPAHAGSRRPEGRTGSGVGTRPAHEGADFPWGYERVRAGARQMGESTSRRCRGRPWGTLLPGRTSYSRYWSMPT